MPKDNYDPSEQSTGTGWPALMTAKVVGKYVGICERQVWKLSATKVLPKPIQIPATRKTVWRRVDIDKFVATLK